MSRRAVLGLLAAMFPMANASGFQVVPPASVAVAAFMDQSAGTPAPSISVAPATLHVGLVMGETRDLAITIENAGPALSVDYEITSAEYGCDGGAEVPWLSAMPSSGTVDAGAFASVTIAVDSTGLEAGGYRATLCVATSDEVHPLIEVPVTLGVNFPPDYTVGGRVDGLLGSGLELMLNGDEHLVIDRDGPFAFATGLDSGEGYEVSVSRQPDDPQQSCIVSNGSGTIGESGVTDVEVGCRGDAIFKDGFEG